MTRNLLVTGMAAAMVMLSGLSAQAAEPKRMLSEKDWEAFRVDGDKGRTCFISSLPTKFLSALTFLSCIHNRVSACGSWQECEIRRQCKTPSGVMQRILGCLRPSCPDAPADG